MIEKKSKKPTSFSEDGSFNTPATKYKLLKNTKLIVDNVTFVTKLKFYQTSPLKNFL